LDDIAKIIRKKSIITTFKPMNTIRGMMKSFKGPIDIVQSFQLWNKEHEDDIHLDCVHKFSLPKHSRNNKHNICLENIRVLAKIDNYSKCALKEAIEIIKHLHNLNKDGGWEVSSSWILLLQKIRNNVFNNNNSNGNSTTNSQSLSD
jgi:hypothetical protein